MPDDEDVQYYLMRQRMALAMSQAARDPAVQKIHSEMARLYAELAGETDAMTVAVWPSIGSGLYSGH